MAEKSSGKTTKLITSLLKRNISSFNEVLDENPVLAFHNEKKSAKPARPKKVLIASLTL